MSKIKIAVIGMGYVGLPLTFELSKYFDVTGFDINKQKISDLKKGKDFENILDKKVNLIKKINFTSNKKKLLDSNFYIIAVPTPINPKKQPDLKSLIMATKMVAKFLKPNDIVVFESTVYPGTTEDVCIPILKKISKLDIDKDAINRNKKTFGCGFCPERVNPGDKNRKITNIIKVISASSDRSLNIIYTVYNKISKKGICKAPSIKIAEAAKIIENVQRDINIALINEFYLLFKKMNLNLRDILDVAKTKWNFLDFTPGLVGGHCIGVDPYYLTYKAKKIGYKPKLILAGRKINDSMAIKVAKDIITLSKKSIYKKNKKKILVMGYAFKKNVSDHRNTKIKDIVMYLKKNEFKITIHDPYVIQKNLDTNLKKLFVDKINVSEKYDIILFSVNHDRFKFFTEKFLKKKLANNGFVYDLTNKIKGSFVAGSL